MIVKILARIDLDRIPKCEILECRRQLPRCWHPRVTNKDGDKSSYTARPPSISLRAPIYPIAERGAEFRERSREALHALSDGVVQAGGELNRS